MPCMKSGAWSSSSAIKLIMGMGRDASQRVSVYKVRVRSYSLTKPIVTDTDVVVSLSPNWEIVRVLPGAWCGSILVVRP